MTKLKFVFENGDSQEIETKQLNKDLIIIEVMADRIKNLQPAKIEVIFCFSRRYARYIKYDLPNWIDGISFYSIEN